jgi:5'-nucleotidase (lipoprotein e(P4) family)
VTKELVVSHTLRLLLVCSILTAAVSCSSRTAPAHEPSAGDGDLPRRHTHENLNTVLWMQTAIEYEMLTEGIYARARQLLDDALESAKADAAWTADTRQTGDLSGLPPAVIMDLDETVLDNSPYEATQIRRDAASFDADLWAEWTNRGEARAIRGAVEFITHAATRGVHVFFVTGRTAADEAATVANLQSLGVSATAENVLTTGEGEWSGTKRGKAYRRAHIAQRYRIVLMVGDDLRDFVAAEEMTPDERAELARRYDGYWTDRWVVLPNPIYGGWESSLRQQAPGSEDAEILSYKRSLLRGFER